MGRLPNFPNDSVPPPPGVSKRIPRRQLSHFAPLPAIQHSPDSSTHEVPATTPPKPQPPVGQIPSKNRRMRRSNLLNSLHPMHHDRHGTIGRTHHSKPDVLLQEAARVALPERSARVALRLPGEVWAAWDVPSFRGEINLLQCFVDGRSVHEHLRKGIIKALAVNHAEIRLANFAEQELDSDVEDVHIPSTDEDERTAILLTVFIGRVLSSGVLAELRRFLHSAASGPSNGLDLGDVGGTAEVVAIDVSASFVPGVGADEALSQHQLARSMGQCFLFGILCEGDKEPKKQLVEYEAATPLETVKEEEGHEAEEPSYAGTVTPHPSAENTVSAEAQLGDSGDRSQVSMPQAHHKCAEPAPPATAAPQRRMEKRKSDRRMPSHDNVLDLSESLVEQFDACFATKSESKLDDICNPVTRVEVST